MADAMLGAVDGTVTTFAVVAGSFGGGLGVGVAVVLGFANLVSDRFSMGVGSFLSAQSRSERRERARHVEEQHIREIPEGEREEVRQIFAAKGFSGETLERIVEVITADRERWIETMLAEEYGLSNEPIRPWSSALATFAAFLCMGAVPLLAFGLPGVDVEVAFAVSGIVTACSFFAAGWAKGRLLRVTPLRSGLETLVLGGMAAVLAYAVARVLSPLLAP